MQTAHYEGESSVDDANSSSPPVAFGEKLSVLIRRKAKTGPKASDTGENTDTHKIPPRFVPARERSMGNNPDEAWAGIKESQSFHSVPSKKAADETRNRAPQAFTRVVCMSDTHGFHRDIAVPRGDILIHAGDFSNTGEPKQVEDLSCYFQELDNIENVVCIAGNHDLTFHPDHYAKVSRRFHRSPFNCQRARNALRNCTYLEDTSADINGVQIHGSPWQPWFCDWAFNLERGPEIRKKWELIPSSTDVLVTHGPPLGRGDLCGGGNRAGCHDLLGEVQDRVRPRLHVFGHIHEGRGVSYDGTTLFVNASNVTMSYAAHNPCIVVDLPLDPSLPAAVVEPQCSLSGTEVIVWLEKRGFVELVPFFKALDPFLEGKELISFERDWFTDICNRLSLLRSEHREARRQLGRALMQLRAESY